MKSIANMNCRITRETGVPQWEKDMEDEAGMFPALLVALRKTVAGLAKYEHQKSFTSGEDLAKARVTLAAAESLYARDAYGKRA